MSAVTGELLADHVDRFVLPGPDALVFANTVGSALHSALGSTTSRRASRSPACPADSMNLRHTSVALAIAEGDHPHAIQTTMGHSTTNVTLDR